MGAVLDDQKLTNEEVKCFKEGTGNLIIISLWNGEKVLDLQRKVSIMKGMLKKHSNIRCHAYIYDVAIGSVRELAPSEILSADSTDYRLGGSLTLRNGRVDKLQFEEGYCQAAAYSGNTSQDNFTFHYYDRDHLGNIRQVIKATGSNKGTVIQTMDYYPFGAEFCDGSTASEVQSRMYNGKELDKMHGLNTYDYGARQYNPVTARWDRVDPLCEKYYAISPYAYCGNNPVSFIDPNGCDSIFAKNGDFIGDDGKNTGNVYCVIGSTKTSVKSATEKGESYSGDLTNLDEVAIIPRGKAAKQVQNDYETAKGPEKGGCLYTDGTVQEWDKGTQPTVSHRKDGSVAVSHGITPFVVNGEKARLGTPVVSWHIHTQIDVPIGNGEKAYLGSSNPSSKDYEYEQTENTGSTFVVGQRN